MTLVVSQLTVIENAVLISFYGEEATTSSASADAYLVAQVEVELLS